MNKTAFRRKTRLAKNGCWVWRGVGSQGGPKNGYARIMLHGRSTSAHRASWMLHRGQIPEGLQVCHHCDNPPCANPEHLFLGTPSDNAQDGLRKGTWRSKRGFRLTKDNIIKAQHLRAGGATYPAIAKKFGVCEYTIRSAILGHSYKWLFAVKPFPRPEDGVACA